MNIWEQCKCSVGQTCPFCMFLAVVSIYAVLGLLVGYLIWRKRKK